MEARLELRHLAPYLPYGLDLKHNLNSAPYKIKTIDIKSNTMVVTDTWDNVRVDLNNTVIKLILRPLSDLTKEIEHNGERFVPQAYFFGNGYLIKSGSIQDLPYWVVQKLFEWKIDVFGLIDAGLAIDVNTLKENPYK